MAIRVKYDIGTAVSVGLVVGKNPDGSDLEQEVVFLPGAILPSNVAPRLVKKLKAGDEHLNSLLALDDDVDSAPARAASPYIFGDDQVRDNPFVDGSATLTEQEKAIKDGNLSVGPDPNLASPGAQGGSVEDGSGGSVDYTDWKRADLEAELAKRTGAGRTVNVVGTGQNGNVIAPDIAKALAEDDAAQA